MSQRTRQRDREALDALRREYLGREFLRFWPPGLPGHEVLPEVVAARCLGIEYGDPGPPLGGETCRECWGECRVWLGNAWGMRHAGGTMDGCTHPCHDGEVWMASAGDATQAQ
ncbi:MAG TPA: hypothetical protein VMV92_12630 [Streptosporangiaceae bacterium]|nr:hypothetical protein [Streptosporangiaceae bacterium]